MTTKLQNVFKRIARLPHREQDALAGVIELELAGDASWEQLFAATTDEPRRTAGSKEMDAHREEGTISLDELRKRA